MKKKIIMGIIFCLFTAGLFLFLWQNSADRNDMLVFRELVNQNDLWTFLKLRNEITSRLLLETLLYGIIKLPYIVFLVITIILVFCGMFSLRYLLKWNDVTFGISLLLILLFPWKSLCEAGIQPVVINYIWSFVFGLIGFIPIRKVLDHKKIRIADYFLYGIPMILACNMEQMAAICFGFCILTLLILRKEKGKGIILSQLLISLLSIGFLLFGPGNRERALTSVNVYWPGFENLNVFQKVVNGYETTLNYYFSISMPLFAFFAFILLVYFISKKAWKKAVVSSMPAIWLIFTVGLKVMEKISHLNILEHLAAVTYVKSGEQFFMYPDYVKITVYSVLLILLIIGFLLYQKTDKKYRIYGVILLAGFLSRIILGFSPTLLASGTRTFTYCTLAIWITASSVAGNLVSKVRKS